MPKEKKEAKRKLIKLPTRALKTVAAVLAVVLILVAGTSITAEALQIDIWGKLASWTKEIFQFADRQGGTIVEEPEKEYNVELKSLQDALAQEEVTLKLVPTWMPEGYISKDLKVTETPRVRNISATYKKNDEVLVINVRQTIGVPAHQVEKNDDLLEVYTVNGVDYYIFSNTETMQVVWSIGEFECMIIGEITLEEMKLMIDSI